MATRYIEKLQEQDLRNRTMAQLRQKGWSLQKIADQYGITRMRVWQILDNLPKQTRVGP